MAHLITTFYRPVIQDPLRLAPVIYLALTGMTVMLWWLPPLWFLGGFLAYSAYHFGDQTGRIREPCGNGLGDCRLSGCPAC